MEYIIKKGRHYCNLSLPIFRISSVSGRVKFIGSFEYYIDKQKDTNKLIGISDSYHHHKNSIRIGWRWSKIMNKIEIMTIVYNDSKRSIEHLCFIEDQSLEYSFEVKVLKDYYVVNFNDQSVFIDRVSNWFLPRIVLKPYFGGTTKSPKDFRMDIDLK